MSSNKTNEQNELIERAAEELALLFIALVEQKENKRKSNETKNESGSKI